jgi:hypothetical protein
MSDTAGERPCGVCGAPVKGWGHECTRQQLMYRIGQLCMQLDALRAERETWRALRERPAEGALH